MKNFLQKARLLLTSVEHSKYFTLVLVFIIAFAAGIVIVASQQQTHKQAEKTTTDTQTEPLFMVDPGGDGNGCIKTVGSIELKECSTVACGKRVKWTYRCDGSHTVSHVIDSSCNCLSCCTGASNSAPGDCIANDSRCLGKNQGATCATNYKCLSPSKNNANNCKFYDNYGNCLTSASCYGTTNCGGCAYSGYNCILLKTGQGFPYACCPKTTTTSGGTTGGGGTGGGAGGTTGGATQGNTSCSRCSDTYKNVRANWQEGDSICDRSNVTSSTTYSLDCTCINDTQYGNKANLPSSDKNIDSSKCSPRCSDKYQYCRTEWNCTTPNCSDTWNAKYFKECSCTQGTDNCNAKGVDTSSCDIDTSKTVPPPPDELIPFDCTSTKDGYQYKCDANCNTTDGWNSSAYNNMTNKTTCQKDSKLCCYKKTGTTTAPQIPDCDSGIQYGECTGAQTNTCSQDNGTRTVTYTTHTSGEQCNQKSLYSQACTQSNCSFNYTCNSGQCVTVTTGGGNTGGGGNTSTCGNGTCESGENSTNCSSDCDTTGGGGGTNRQPTTSTILTFNLGLDGIGSAGDHINPDATDSNKNPKTTVRKVTISVLNSTGVVAENTEDANYNSGIGKLSLSVDLGTSLSTGVYTIKAKSDGYLKKNLSTTQNITAGQTNTLPDTNLVVGDINNDNTISILDYNILISCSLFSKDNGNLCDQNGTNKTLSDLDNDGTVNQYDYSLFVREFSAQKGD